MTTSERFRLVRGWVCYGLWLPVHWLYFKLLRYAGDWIYREERIAAMKAGARRWP